ncbi:hypothetical protein MPTK1_4g23110 [Marchantia polymorpha subsp. ruderalis]|uniref:Uncharacterized protein n=2 Tax=Marchantia polymorpha TaxID=3197 RepID=A0AAF6BCV6_MARPO|nr:hypothetical protein MARPO_0020s0074 [Marchantia polymorpha]BBN09840.1 hypothetical protein Mp_4g23110 [Marchantia polymorpha subsp. ruderalis]|eukprot:PTQ44417.1 hypothetical protein MARPO_0020s0074 [Marchantia polymorpha]
MIIRWTVPQPHWTVPLCPVLYRSGIMDSVNCRPERTGTCSRSRTHGCAAVVKSHRHWPCRSSTQRGWNRGISRSPWAAVLPRDASPDRASERARERNGEADPPRRGEPGAGPGRAGGRGGAGRGRLGWPRARERGAREHRSGGDCGVRFAGGGLFECGAVTSDGSERCQCGEEGSQRGGEIENVAAERGRGRRWGEREGGREGAAGAEEEDVGRGGGDGGTRAGAAAEGEIGIEGSAGGDREGEEKRERESKRGTSDE